MTSSSCVIGILHHKMAIRAGFRKNWSDSSGIVLLSGAFKYARAPTPLSKLGDLGENPLIVPLDETDEREWEVALVKRSSKTGFFANSYVFPGGRLDAADSSPEWLKIFARLSNDPFRPILAAGRPNSSSRQRLPLYKEVPEGPILGEVAFRICAVRELFEEAGLLLARGEEEVTEVSDWVPGTFPPAVKSLEAGELDHWRQRVHNNAEEFLTLCSELKCVPDIWSLLEWSDWLTPRNFHIRYDTLFYLCCLDSQPHITPDGSEIVDAKWYTPSKALQLHTESKIFITPPQFVDIHVLRTLGPVPCLHSYALRENLRGSLQRHSKIRILTKDKVLVSMIKHDDLYPALPEELALTSPPPHLPQSPTLSHIHLHPSQSSVHEYECPTHTADELRSLSTNLSRMELRGKGDFQIYDNVMSEKIASHVEEYNHIRDNHPLNSKL